MGLPEPVTSSDFLLADIDPDDDGGLDRAAAEESRSATVDELSDLQERLFAESRRGSARRLLLVLQGMDTAGKGGVIRHVVGDLDPQGVRVAGFGVPTEEERAHDFLWRIRRRLPPPGIVGVFDRSHYEDVLIHRVRGLSSPTVIEERYGLIRDFEQELVDGGTTIIKAMLHISPDEQRERLAARLDRPDKHWKFDPADIDERSRWSAYQEAYELAIRRTATPSAPWYVVPSNRKWYSRFVVRTLLLEALRGLDPQWPPADFDVERERARLAAT